MSKLVNLDEIFNILNDDMDENEILSSMILAEISAKLIEFRTENNMSQAEFAKYLGVSQAMVSKFESEEYNFTIKKLVELCNKMNKALSISITDSYENKEKNIYCISTDSLVDDDEEFKISKNYKNTDWINKQSLNSLLRYN